MVKSRALSTGSTAARPSSISLYSAGMSVGLARRSSDDPGDGQIPAARASRHLDNSPRRRPRSKGASGEARDRTKGGAMSAEHERVALAFDAAGYPEAAKVVRSLVPRETPE